MSFITSHNDRIRKYADHYLKVLDNDNGVISRSHNSLITIRTLTTHEEFQAVNELIETTLKQRIIQ